MYWASTSHPDGAAGEAEPCSTRVWDVLIYGRMDSQCLGGPGVPLKTTGHRMLRKWVLLACLRVPLLRDASPEYDVRPVLPLLPDFRLRHTEAGAPSRALVPLRSAVQMFACGHAPNTTELSYLEVEKEAHSNA